jgi:hypothetical protein
MMKKITPNTKNGECRRNVIAIMVAENTCLLGKDSPFVSFFMTGGISNNSYGLGRFMILRKIDSSKKLTAGTKSTFSN